MTKIQYENFIDALLEAEKLNFAKKNTLNTLMAAYQLKLWQSVEETLRFGPMKPVGLMNQIAKKNHMLSFNWERQCYRYTV